MADIFNFTDIWNNGATVFDAIKCNVTDTASDAASLLINMQVASSTKFSVRKDGHVVAASEAIGGATIGANALAVTGSGTFSGFGLFGSLSSGIQLGGTANATLSFINAAGPTVASRLVGDSTGSGGPSQWQLGSTGWLGWNSAAAINSGTIDAILSRNAAGIIQFGTTAANASGAWLAAKGTLTGGTLADQAQVLAITATQPASPTGTQNAIIATITGAGSASQTNYAQKLLYGAGYTGTSFNAALNVVNTNAGSLSSGLFVGLADTTPSVSAALIVDNGATTQPIFLARDNGSTVFTIADGGNVTSTAQIQAAFIQATSQLFTAVGGLIYFQTRSLLASPSDGVLTISNNGQSDFNRLQFGGTTSSFPAIKRSTTSLQVRLADDSADAGITMSTIGASGIVIVSNATDSTTTTSGSVQVAGGMAVRKRIFADGITASAGLQTAVICQSSAGELIADSVACLASSARFKDLLGDAEKGALDKIIRVPVQRWKYRREEGSVFPDNYYSEHIGPTAEDIEAIDSRLVGRDKEGKVRSISTDQLLALAIQAIQEQQVQIEELKARAA